MAKINVQNTEITVVSHNEMLYNPNFNCTEFGTFRNMAGSNNFVLSVKTWIAVLINEGVPQGERITKCQTPCDNKAVTNQSVLK